MSSQLLINEPPLQVLPTLAREIGLNEAIILQQIHYWLNPSFNKNFIEGRHWVYNSYDDWRAQFKFWSKNTIRRVIASLDEQGFLIINNFNQNRFDHKKWYSINYEQLQGIGVWANQSVQNGQIDNADVGKSISSDQVDRTNQLELIEEPNLGESLTENTSRDYTKTNAHAARAFEFSKLQDMVDVWNRILKKNPPPSNSRRRASPFSNPAFTTSSTATSRRGVLIAC